MCSQPPTPPCEPFGTRRIPSLRCDFPIILRKIGYSPVVLSCIVIFPSFLFSDSERFKHFKPCPHSFPLLPADHANAPWRTQLSEDCGWPPGFLTVSIFVMPCSQTPPRSPISSPLTEIYCSLPDFRPCRP